MGRGHARERRDPANDIDTRSERKLTGSYRAGCSDRLRNRAWRVLSCPSKANGARWSHLGEHHGTPIEAESIDAVGAREECALRLRCFGAGQRLPCSARLVTQVRS